jgi:hypothetical protein
MSTFLKGKGTWRQAIICLRPPFPSPSRYTLYEYVIHTPVLIHTRKGIRGVGEPVRRLEGASSQEGSKIPTGQTVSPVYKLYQTPVKTTFRVWCLYRYLVMREYQREVYCRLRRICMSHFRGWQNYVETLLVRFTVIPQHVLPSSTTGQLITHSPIRIVLVTS